MIRERCKISLPQSSPTLTCHRTASSVGIPDVPILDPSSRQILGSVFVMGLLTFVMFVWMSLARLPSMKRAGLRLADAEHPEDLRRQLDSAGRKAGDNYNHLFEAPVAFYAVSLATVAANIADPSFATAAWTFVGFRILHSAVQATINKVPLRLAFYLASWSALAFMIIHGTLKLFASS